MAMIACHECKETISSTAKSCPKCGAPTPKKKVWPWVVGTPLLLLGALILWVLSIPEYEREAKSVRRACEQMAAPHQQHICDQQYAEALRAGREAAGK